jgi:hypothetical protein
MVVNINDIGVRDLIELYTFVRADADRSFGVNERGKAIVRARLAEIEATLYKRVYGTNPFVLGTIEGQTPESINLTKFDKNTAPKTYVVSDGGSPKKVEQE